MNEFDVVVAGGGPVGLMLACELRLGGAEVLVLERLAEIDQTIKAGSITVPTAEAFYRRGLLAPLVEAQRQGLEKMAAFFGGAAPADGPPSPPPKRRVAGHFGGIMVGAEHIDLDDPEFRNAGPATSVMMVSQQAIEEIVGGWAAELGVQVRRGVELTGFEQDGDGVRVDAGGDQIQAGWLVGCDGGRSLVRRTAGFDFPGTDPEITGHQAMVEMDGAEKLAKSWHHTEGGLFAHGPLPGRILTVEFDGPPADRDAEVTAAELEASLLATSGVEVNITKIISATRFTDNARQASSYRCGRVLLAGDAAHVHSPFGGQGLNLGIGDAVNLGWKLAATVRGDAPDGLLDTYTTERHPIGAGVLEWTRANVALMRTDPQTRTLRGVMTDLLNTVDGATYLAKNLSGILQRYDLPGDHPLIGSVAPDLELADGTRLNEHCAEGTPVVFDLADAGLSDQLRPWGQRVRVITGKAAGSESITGLLVRPDGYVVWATDDARADGCVEALTRLLVPADASDPVGPS